MIETALQIVPKGAVEHAKDVAQETLDELSERLKDVELPKLMTSTSTRERRRVPWMLLLLAALGIGAAVAIARRRRSSANDDFAPDPFGNAVEQERASGALGQRPIATPGA